MTTEESKERWLRVWQLFGEPTAGDRIFHELKTAYTAPDRHYHTLDHVADCLTLLDACKEQANDPEAIEMALWFHDAVYDTHAGDNEEQSAHWAVRELGGGERAETVARLVLATKHGATASSDKGEILIADIDLAILGAEETKFWAYEEAIRREYVWVPEEIFRSKRAEILRRFLERDRLYQTPFFHDKYDNVARKNLSASIDRLSE